MRQTGQSDSGAITMAESEDVVAALRQLQEAELALTRASSHLERTPRKGWWYATNRAYHATVEMRKVLQEAVSR